MSEEDKITKKAVTWLQLGITIFSVFAIGFKIYYDVRTNAAAIEELKKKSERNNEYIQEIKTNTAVMNVRLEAVDERTVNIFDKVEKINDNLLKAKP